MGAATVAYRTHPSANCDSTALENVICEGDVEQSEGCGEGEPGIVNS